MPAHLYATNKRIIVVRDILGIHKSIKIMRYEDILETRVEKGVLFAKLHFGLLSEPTFVEQNLKWMSFLNYRNLLEFIEYVDKVHPGIA